MKKIKITSVLLAVLLGMACLTDAAQALDPLSGPDIDKTTLNLIALNNDYNRTKKPETLNKIISLAKARKKLLLELLEENPAAVLRNGLPKAVKNTFPAEAQSFIEEEVSIEGELEVRVEDDFVNQTARYTRFLKTKDQGILSLYLVGEELPSLQSGTKVQVHGLKVDNALVVQYDKASFTLTQALQVNTNPFGEQKALVILVNFQDKPTQPYTLSYAKDMFFTTTSNFFLENSYQQTWLTGDVYGWYTIPLNSSVCDSLSLASYAKQSAAAAGANLSSYTHYVYAFPQNACGWWGLATVGGNPSQTWINGSLELDVSGHELGHNLGLEHSHSLSCTDGNTFGSNCVTVEYGDGLDIMGWAPQGHFNAFQKERLGWLNYNVSPAIATIDKSGTYSVGFLEAAAGAAKALKIFKSYDALWNSKDWYYLEYRQPVGFDSYFNTYYSSMDKTNILKGVAVHHGSDNNGGNSNWLLDMTPETYQLYTRDPAITAGKTFSDPYTGMTISVLSTSTTDSSVSIDLSAPTACLHQAPSMSISPWSQWGYAGQTLSYSLSVANNDTLGCSSSSFTITPTLPDAGWSQLPSSITFTLAPETKASQTIGITSPKTAALGNYVIIQSVTHSADSSLTKSFSMSYYVQQGSPPTDTAAPTVTITQPTDGATVAVQSAVLIAASASDNKGVTRVEFYLKGRTKDKLLGSSTTSPYSIVWAAPKGANKNYSFQCRAYDAAGNVGISQIVTVTSK